MKKFIKYAVLLQAALMTVSCAKEMDYYNAQTTEPFAGINDSELVLEGKTESAKISFKSNMWWTAHVEYETGQTEKWCQITPDNGYGNVEISVTSTRNYQASSPRKAKIVIQGDDKNTKFTKEFTVIQNPSSPYIDIVDIEQSLDVPIVRSVNQISVKSNNDWNATSTGDWCTVASNGKAGSETLTLTCTSNTTGQLRECVVSVTSKSDSKLSKSFKVSQSDEFGMTVVTLEKTPASFKASWEPVVGGAQYHILVKKVDGEVSTIDAGTALEWDLASDPLFAEPQYAGYVAISVKTLSEDPEVFSISAEKEANSHFTSGKGTEADPFIIGDEASLNNITVANKVLAGAVYKLDYTPDMKNFKSICSLADPFAGVFHGNGKTISGWKNQIEVGQSTDCGFFNAIASGAKVDGLKFSGCQIEFTKGEGSADTNFGFVAGKNAGEIKNIELTGCSTSTETGASPVVLGAVCGENSGKILSCNTAGGRLSAAEDRNKTDVFNCGGIAGYNTENGLIQDCVNGNEIIACDIIGGIAGYNDGSVKACGNTGRITANYYFGGITGYVKTTGKGTCHITNCYNTGTLVMDEPAGASRGAAYVGGITSRIHSTGDAVSGCWNSGEMIVGSSASSSNLRIGGLVGHVNNTGTLKDSYFTGNVTIAGKVNYGGIVGEFADKKTKIVNCYSTGKVTATEAASGNIYDAFGKLAASAVVTSCYALSNGGKKFMGGTTTGVDALSGTKTEAELKTQDTFSGWDFSSVWEMKGYPQLKANPAK